MKLSSFAKAWASAAFIFLISVPNGHATIPLVSLQPQDVRARDPRRDATPGFLPYLQLRERDSRLVVRFTVNSEVSYAVPAGQNNFSGVLVYADVNNRQADEDTNVSNRLSVRILVDGKQVFQTVMDDASPPQEFSIPLAGARRLTIVSDQEYSWETFALAEAYFSDQRRATFSGFLPAAGEGYVDFMPVSRQGMFHVFRPGESVPVTAYFGHSAEGAQVAIRLIPEQSSPRVPEATIAIPLRPNLGTVSAGTANWNVPTWRGPAMLDVQERVNGRTVFRRRVRVAIAPEIDLAGIADSPFAVHTSSSGFLRVEDEFASLWGAKWDRVFIRWEIVESAPGHYDFSRADAIVESLRAQNMRVLGVLGEESPGWVGAPSPQYDAAWKRFVEETVRHYRGKIDHWDMFNEVDVKHEHVFAQADMEFDLRLLRSGANAIHQQDPSARIVCCSTGATPWLPYDKRLFDAGLLPSLDIVSLHPYELTAPEERDGAFNYEERLAALDRLVRSYGEHKPIWATEANWILGSRGEPDVTAPDLDEHTQAEYVVRVNLLSLSNSVPYFLHMPFYHSHHKQPHLDALSAYANMSSLLSGATNTRRLMEGPDTYGFSWDTPNGVVTAVWTTHGTATVAFSGLQSPGVVDFYGNPLLADTSALSISVAPTFVLARSAMAPALKILKAPPAPTWHSLVPVEQWAGTKESTIANVSGGVEVTSQPAKYTYQLRSPEISVQPNACDLARVTINLKRGSVMLFVVDKATGKRVGDAVYVSHVPDGISHQVEFRFLTGSVQSLQLLLADANLQPTVSQFEVLNPAQIALCP